MSRLIEEYTNGICGSISCVSEYKLGEAVQAGVEILNGTANEDDFSTFYGVACYIVEPEIENEEAAEEYRNFMDNNSENWQSWTEQHFGPDWGMIVKVVAEYGY